MSFQTRRLTRVLSLALAVVFGACGNGEPGPTGAPGDVVAAAPDITVSTSAAMVETAAPGVTGKGTASFADGVTQLAFAPAAARVPFGVREPVAVVDLVRGAVHVRSYGGAEVQGIGTKRYEIIVDIARALRHTPVHRRAPLEALHDDVGAHQIWADVFVDAGGRIRRALVPVNLKSDRPYGRDRRIPELVSIDFSKFATKGTK